MQTHRERRHAVTQTHREHRHAVTQTPHEHRHTVTQTHREHRHTMTETHHDATGDRLCRLQVQSYHNGQNALALAQFTEEDTSERL